ncbi:MAG: pyridoxamine 5'-phosphate oxidase family protein [Tistlia sp.]|uniref:pyridoxamine 5'-phosphate oxidase family protein n=1 Tax=Tistlia sp. TaxID=3057121 RepID=UPI0034A426F7
MTENSETAARDKLWHLVEEIGTGMLVTEDEGLLRGRPMTVTARPELNELHMLTRRSSHKAKELAEEAHASMVFADREKGEYVSLSGAARISQDREEIRALWGPYADAWFDEGPEGDDVAMVRFRALRAEYWDTTTSVLKQAWQIALAARSDETPQLGEQRKLKL